MSNNFQALEIYVQAHFSSKRVCRCLGLASSNLDIGLYGNKKYRYIYVLNHK